MRTSRIYTTQKLSAHSSIEITGDTAHYLSRVLRVKKDQAVVLFDGSGYDFNANVEAISRRDVHLQVNEKSAGLAEPAIKITLLQGLSRGQKMDVTIQKAVELGVHAIRVLSSTRNVVKLSPERAASRQQHWQTIAINAAQQCGRSVVPRVHEMQSLQDYLAQSPALPGLFATPHVQNSLRSTLKSLQLQDDALSLFIGPEGGIDEAEQEALLSAGFIACNAGKRILRTETAAIALAAIVQYELGDLG